MTRPARRAARQPSQRRRTALVACVHLPAYLHAATLAAVEREGTTARAYVERATRAYLDAHGERPLNLAAQLQLDALADYLRPPPVEPGDGWQGAVVEQLSVRMARDLLAAVDVAASSAQLTRSSYLRRALACAVEGDAEAEAERLAGAPDRWAQVLALVGAPADAKMPADLLTGRGRREAATLARAAA